MRPARLWRHHPRDGKRRPAGEGIPKGARVQASSSRTASVLAQAASENRAQARAIDIIRVPVYIARMKSKLAIIALLAITAASVGCATAQQTAQNALAPLKFQARSGDGSGFSAEASANGFAMAATADGFVRLAYVTSQDVEVYRYPFKAGEVFALQLVYRGGWTLDSLSCEEAVKVGLWPFAVKADDCPPVVQYTPATAGAEIRQSLPRIKLWSEKP